MTKKELADKITNDFGTSKADAERMVATVFDEIASALVKGEEVSIAGFGKFVTLKKQLLNNINYKLDI
jgi:DNA-binding protein HU-beta